MFIPRVMRRKLTPKTLAYPKSAGFTVLDVDAKAGECLTVRTRDLHAWTIAEKITVSEAIKRLIEGCPHSQRGAA